MLKLFLTQREGAATFPEFYYLGTEPLDGRGEKVDVVITKYTNPVGDALYSRWYFHPQDGRFLGFDTALDKDVDDCRIRFQSWKEFDGRKFPSAFEVRHGDSLYDTFTVDSAAFGKVGPENKKPEKK